MHTPVDVGKAQKIPKAKAAIQKEWHKLGVQKRAWDVDAVRPRAEVEAEAIREGKTVHFGSLSSLCHIKHSELHEGLSLKDIRTLMKDELEWKGRVVFRGDITRDESGYYAVFSEQGTSASHMAATKFLAVSRKRRRGVGRNWCLYAS